MLTRRESIRPAGLWPLYRPSLAASTQSENGRNASLAITLPLTLSPPYFNRKLQSRYPVCLSWATPTVILSFASAMPFDLTCFTTFHANMSCLYSSSVGLPVSYTSDLILIQKLCVKLLHKEAAGNLFHVEHRSCHSPSQDLEAQGVYIFLLCEDFKRFTAVRRSYNYLEEYFSKLFSRLPCRPLCSMLRFRRKMDHGVRVVCIDIRVMDRWRLCRLRMDLHV